MELTTTSALLCHGIAHLRTLLGGLTEWLNAHDFGSLSDVRGRLSRQIITNPVAYPRVLPQSLARFDVRW